MERGRGEPSKGGKSVERGRGEPSKGGKSVERGRGEPSKRGKSKRGSSRSPIQVDTSPPMRQASFSNSMSDVSPRYSYGHRPLSYVGNLRSSGPENSDVRMEFVCMAPPVNTLNTSPQLISGIRQNAGANLTGPFDSSTPGPSPDRVGTTGARVQPMSSYAPCSSSTPGPSPARVGTTDAMDRPQSRHLPCAVAPTRSAPTAPVPPAPVAPLGDVNDGAGPSASSEAGSDKKKKKNKIGAAIVTCPVCGAQSASQSDHYNHFRVLFSNVNF